MNKEHDNLLQIALHEYSLSIERFDKLRDYMSIIIGADGLMITLSLNFRIGYPQFFYSLKNIYLFNIALSLFITAFAISIYHILVSIRGPYLALLNPEELIGRYKEISIEDLYDILLSLTISNREKYSSHIKVLGISIFIVLMGLISLIFIVI